LGIAIGMYLPISSSFPLFIGGMIALMIRLRLQRSGLSKDAEKKHKQVGTLIACGLVAGAALVDVLLAITFSLLHSPDALRITGKDWHNYGVILSIITTIALAAWIDRRVRRSEISD